MKNNWRIYLCGRGLGGHRPFLRWCKNAVEEGKLPKRFDRNGKPYIFVNDLLPYKGQRVGGVNTGSINMFNFLHEGIIAFGEVKKMSNRILQDGAKNIKPNYAKLLEAELPNLGYVASYNIKGVEPYLREVGLEEWIEDWMYNIDPKYI